MVTDSEFVLAEKAMKEAGKAAGKASGSWIADGNTSEDSLRRLLKMWDEGDPAAPCPPNPFSGEWAGDPSLEDVVNDVTDMDADELTPEEVDDLGRAFEDAFSEAWQDEAERTVRAMLPD